MTNFTNSTNAPVDQQSLEDEQRAYDALDPRMRKFLQNAPEKLSASWALEMQQRNGVEELLRSGNEMLKRRYPGFTPI